MNKKNSEKGPNLNTIKTNGLAETRTILLYTSFYTILCSIAKDVKMILL